MAIKGAKRARIQYTWVTCKRCGHSVTSSEVLNGVTLQPCGVCQDCRAEEYGVAPHMVWEHEKQYTISNQEDQTCD